MICSQCCAQKRGPDCGECDHYADAKAREFIKLRDAKLLDTYVPNDPTLVAELDQAMFLLEASQAVKAEGIVAKIYREAPEWHSSHYAMGVLAMVKEDFPAAIQYFDAAIAIFPYAAESWFNKAVAHQKRMELTPMVTSFRKVLEYGPAGSMHVEMATETLRSLTAVIRTQSGVSLDQYMRAKALFDAAFIELEQANHAAAIAGFLEVLKITPGHAPSWENLGICHGYLGDKQSGLSALDKALEIDPGYAPAISNREILANLAEGEVLPKDAFKAVDFGAGLE